MNRIILTLGLLMLALCHFMMSVESFLIPYLIINVPKLVSIYRGIQETYMDEPATLADLKSFVEAAKTQNGVHVDPQLLPLLTNSSATFSLMVTFKELPSLETSLHDLFGYVKKHAQRVWESVSSPKRQAALYTTAELSNLSFESFKRDVHLGFVAQGFWIYDTMKATLLALTSSIERKLARLPRWKSIKKYIVSHSWLMQGDASVVRLLIKSGLVTEIHLDRPFTVPGLLNVHAHEIIEKDDPGFHVRPNGVEWGVEYVGAPAIWNRTRGQSRIYASADTGVDWKHPILAQAYAGLGYSGYAENITHDYAWWDAVKVPIKKGLRPGRCGINSQVPCDDSGHGSHTTSTVVGSDGYGVAPDAQWIACRNMDQGVGSTSTYLDCLEFFLAPTNLKGEKPNAARRPHVIGNSYGCPSREGCAPLAFHAAVRTLQKAGILMSVSAGNDGPECSSISDPPAYEPLVLTVGASSFMSDNIAPFSSRGPIVHVGGLNAGLKPQVVAPGHRVRGAYLDGGFAVLSGTSMASPHVSGALLLLSAARPDLERAVDNELPDLLMSTARPILSKTFGNPVCGSDQPDSTPNNIYGYGMIRVNEAFKACQSTL